MYVAQSDSEESK